MTDLPPNVVRLNADDVARASAIGEHGSRDALLATLGAARYLKGLDIAEDKSFFLIQLPKSRATVDVLAPRLGFLGVYQPNPCDPVKVADILVFAKPAPLDSNHAGCVWIPGYAMRGDFFRRWHRCEGLPDDYKGLSVDELRPIHHLVQSVRTCAECNAPGPTLGAFDLWYCRLHYPTGTIPRTAPPAQQPTPGIDPIAAALSGV